MCFYIVYYNLAYLKFFNKIIRDVSILWVYNLKTRIFFRNLVQFCYLKYCPSEVKTFPHLSSNMWMPPQKTGQSKNESSQFLTLSSKVKRISESAFCIDRNIGCCLSI